ncbi:hypothetical protein GQ54DRAFT_33376 [Martensiomyces pterosporus]|nr:hypothetical protein GQ54DRAFT_33376 [Martensiomyces pterosporus]
MPEALRHKAKTGRQHGHMAFAYALPPPPFPPVFSRRQHPNRKPMILAYAGMHSPPRTLSAILPYLAQLLSAPAINALLQEREFSLPSEGRCAVMSWGASPLVQACQQVWRLLQRAAPFLQTSRLSLLDRRLGGTKSQLSTHVESGCKCMHNHNSRCCPWQSVLHASAVTYIYKYTPHTPNTKFCDWV